MTNATLASMASVFRADAAGDAAVGAAEQLDATVRSLTDEQRSSLRDAGVRIRNQALAAPRGTSRAGGGAVGGVVSSLSRVVGRLGS